VAFLIGKFSVFGSILHGSMIRMLASRLALPTCPESYRKRDCCNEDERVVIS
jgi:hypothetical protein